MLCSQWSPVSSLITPGGQLGASVIKSFKWCDVGDGRAPLFSASHWMLNHLEERLKWCKQILRTMILWVIFQMCHKYLKAMLPYGWTHIPWHTENCQSRAGFTDTKLHVHSHKLYAWPRLRCFPKISNSGRLNCVYSFMRLSAMLATAVKVVESLVNVRIFHKSLLLVNLCIIN